MKAQIEGADADAATLGRKLHAMRASLKSALCEADADETRAQWKQFVARLTDIAIAADEVLWE